MRGFAHQVGQMFTSGTQMPWNDVSQDCNIILFILLESLHRALDPTHWPFDIEIMLVITYCYVKGLFF